MKIIISRYWKMREVGKELAIKFGEVSINSNNRYILFQKLGNEVEKPKYFDFLNMQPWKFVEKWKSQIKNENLINDRRSSQKIEEAKHILANFIKNYEKNDELKTTNYIYSDKQFYPKQFQFTNIPQIRLPYAIEMVKLNKINT